MKKLILIGLAVLLAAGLGVWLWQSWQTTPPDTNESIQTQDIVVQTPQPGAMIANPLTVSGTARGTWYFEASFPVRVEDANGTVLGQAPATAQGDWMTTSTVPFIGTIYFVTSTTQNGFVIFAKDNPSGLPEYDAEVRVPITFTTVASAPTSTTTIKVFWQNESQLLPGQDICTTVIPVTRIVTATPAIGRAALEVLLKGPTAAEISAGYMTNIPANVGINRLEITPDGVARVDFSVELDRGVGGSCRVTAIRRQINETLVQFPTVKSIVISINGETETILQP